MAPLTPDAHAPGISDGTPKIEARMTFDRSGSFLFTSSLPVAFSLVMALCLVVGCGDGEPRTSSSANTTEAEQGGDASDSDTEAGEFVLGDLIEPFDPPPLEELIANNEWTPGTLRDPIRWLREAQADEPKLATEAEALKLKNDSPEANEKISEALGRVRPDPGDGFYNDQQGVDWDAQAIRHAYMDIKSSNPLLSNSVTEAEVNSLTQLGLFTFDWKMRPFGSSAFIKSWETSENRLYDKVVMRDDLTWSDGKPITAHDVAFSFKVIMSSKVPIPALRTQAAEFRWIEAYDDHTLVYFHKRSLATNVWNLNFPIAPKHIYEKSIYDDPSLERSKHHSKYEDDPVVGGPYTITKRNRGQEIILDRRESFYMHEGKQVRDKPFFKRVRMKVIPDLSVALLALNKGDLEQMELKPFQWMTQTTDKNFYRLNTKVRSSRWLTWSFQWNLKTPFFQDLLVRQAMGYAFDHDELLENLRLGLDRPGVGTFHPESPYASKPSPPAMKQDLKRAVKLLNEAGWRDSDGDGVLDKTINGRSVPFEFTMICRNQQWREDVCNLLKENLERMGVICNVRPLEATVVATKLFKHEFQAAFGGWSTGADPDTSQNIWGTDEGRNFGYYSNKEVDRLFDEAKLEFDPEKRIKLYQQINQLIYDDQPYTWLFHESAFYAFNKRWRGYNFSPRGTFSFDPGFSSMYKPAMQ